MPTPPSPPADSMAVAWRFKIGNAWFTGNTEASCRKALDDAGLTAEIEPLYAQPPQRASGEPVYVQIGITFTRFAGADSEPYFAGMGDTVEKSCGERSEPIYVRRPVGEPNAIFAYSAKNATSIAEATRTPPAPDAKS